MSLLKEQAVERLCLIKIVKPIYLIVIAAFYKSYVEAAPTLSDHHLPSSPPSTLTTEAVRMMKFESVTV